MNKLIATSVTAATVLFGQCAFADDHSTDLQQELRAMQDQLRANQERLNTLQDGAGQEFVTRDEARRLIENEMTVMVDERVEQGMAQMRDSSPILTLGPNIDGLDIRGDLTFRWVRQDVDLTTYTATNVGNNNFQRSGSATDANFTEDAFAVRLHLGGVWKSEGWEIGIGLKLSSTSISSNSFYNNRNARSPDGFNVYGDDGVFGSDNIDLDYAYARHTWGNLAVTIGQQHNPFRSTWIMWDEDTRPIGVTAEYVYQDFFFTAGGYDVRHFGRDEGEGYLFVGQVGVDTTYDQLNIVAAAAWYYGNEQVADSNTTSADPLLGSTLTGLGNGYQYNLLDLYLNLTYNFQDEVTLGLYGEYVQNFGAEGDSTNSAGFVLAYGEDPEDNNQAWIIGGNISWRNVTVDYGYAHIESDATIAAIADGEFNSAYIFNGSNAEGHKVSVSYDVNENLSVTGTAFFTELSAPVVVSSSITELEEQRYQVDVKYVF